MADENTLTIVFDGDIALEDFTEAIQKFQALIQALSQDVAGRNAISWQVDDLRASSAVATIRGVATRPNAVVANVINAYNIVGTALERRTAIPYSPNVQRKARALAGMIRRSILSIRFETAQHDAVITSSPSVIEEGLTTYSYGQIEGRVETLTKRKGLRFVLYDLIFDRAISCYLAEDHDDIMRGAWGRKVRVEGLIGRAAPLYRPFVVREITRVEILNETPPGSYRQARGIISPTDDAGPPEETLRSLRDEW